MKTLIVLKYNFIHFLIKGFLIGASLILMHPHLIDYNLMYYDAKFKENGGINSGYLLKPFA